jgi:Pectate lyase superfamily protein
LKLSVNCAVAICLVSLASAGSASAFARKDVRADCGAIPNDWVDDTAAIQACITAAGGYAAIYFPPGQYDVSSTLKVSNGNVTLYSDARDTAMLSFTGCGATNTALEFAASNSGILFGGGVRGLGVRAIGGIACPQTAIHIVDGSGIKIEDAGIYTTDGVGTNEGIRIEGREWMVLRDVYIRAANPIVLGRNPNYPYIDGDFFTFENVYATIVAPGKHWAVSVKDGGTLGAVQMSNIHIGPQFVAVGGCGILNWVTTSTPQPDQNVSYNLTITGARHEQRSPDTCDQVIHIDVPAALPLSQLIVEDVHFGEAIAPSNFPADVIFTNHVQSITVANSHYWPSLETNFINVQNALWLEVRNNFISPHANIVTPGLVLREGAAYRGKFCCTIQGFNTTDTASWGRPGVISP